MNKKIDLDKVVSNLENTEKPIFEQSDLAQVMNSLDKDAVDTRTHMSDIDFNTRLTHNEISACLIMDEFQRLGVLDKRISLSRQKKRLAVSLDGKGRQEKVDIVRSERESVQGTGFMSKFKGLFQRRE